MATVQIERFKTVTRGNIAITGNTLGLSKLAGENKPGTEHSIGAFITIDTSQTADGGWPAGTTLDYTQNSSSAVLKLPDGAKVLYAELMWGGTCISSSNSPNQDITSNMNDSIEFTDSTGKVNTVSPDPLVDIGPYLLVKEYQNKIGSQLYQRGANVTDIVAASGKGTYTVGKVPATMDPLNDENQYAGWALCVAYQLDSQPLNYLAIEQTSIDAGPNPSSIGGFQTPSVGAIVAKLFLVMGGGDVGFHMENDQVVVGKMVATSPNNLEANFAASQINDEDGNLDTTGTFGTRNANPSTNTQVEAGRQGWDITGIDISSALTYNQNTVNFDVSFKGGSYPQYPKLDDYVVGLIAYAISASAANIEPIKTPSTKGVEPGQELTYTIVLDNSKGSLDANNVLVYDTIPSGTTFVDGSVSVDGVAITGANPQDGITIASIQAGSQSTVEFKVLVGNEIPNPNPIVNSSRVEYEYTSSGELIKDSSTSNSVETYVGSANFDDGGVVKSVDKEYAGLGDSIKYDITLKNTGTVDAINCVIIDTLPSGVTFVPSSLTGGTGDPSSGINIGTIAAGASSSVSFQITVDTTPNPNPIINEALLKYEYSLSPDEPNKTGEAISNDVTTQIKYVDINPDAGDLVKSQDKDTIALGDTLTYSITLNNTGNTDLSGTIIDIIPDGTEFVPESVTINGAPSAQDPSNGIDIGSVGAGQNVVVSFDVKVTELPVSGVINNKATLNYSYILDPAQPPVEKSVDTNETSASVLSADLSGITKSVDKAYADIADEIEYTITLPNSGNADAINVVIMDTIASTGVSFVPGSIVGGAGSPSTGINVGTIAKGQTATVKFKVVVDQMPDPNPIVNSAVVNYEYSVGTSVNKLQNISNEVSTQVNHGGFDGGTGDNFVKSADKDVVKVGDTLTYTITMNNVGNVDLIDVMVKDALSSDVSFVDGSATVNGAPSMDNPNTGIKVGVVPASSSVVVKFAVKVNAIPTSGALKNSASTTYSYYVDPNGPPKTGSDDTNEISTKVEKVEIEMTKSADKKAVVSGMTITYTIIVNNKGTVALENAIIKDQIPPQTQYAEGSVRINGSPSSESILKGVKIANLNPGQSTNISFDVLVL